ncbi:hypothetical protein BGZ60DRAFT_526377 [Tricladium varicosporioides]|nr:hypothetical protein BGZ60DRAFT_526377 [Hymenoscyphus varicosporioides]
MYLPRILSIAASSAIFIIAIAAASFSLHGEWHRPQRVKNYRSPSFWKSILDPIFTFIITTGLSISLLICSILWNEAWIEIFLLLFGRFLLMRQAAFLWKFVPSLQGQFGSSTNAATLMKYFRWILIHISGGLFGLSVVIVIQVARNKYRNTMLKYGLISFASEFLALSVIYTYLIWRTWWARARARASIYCRLVLPLFIAVLGSLSAFILCFLKPGDQISWVMALWIHFGTASLWLLRSIAIGVHGFLSRRGRPSASSAQLIVPPRTPGFDRLEENV